MLPPYNTQLKFFNNLILQFVDYVQNACAQLFKALLA